MKTQYLQATQVYGPTRSPAVSHTCGHVVFKAVQILVASTFLVTGSNLYAADCAVGKTLKDGVLTIATGNPAYFPWVMDNNPASGNGFEAAVAYEVADRMGFAQDKVEWTSASFDQSIQPGAKNFDFNVQQFSITEARDKVVDFSLPYYSAAMAVLVRKSSVDMGAEATVESLRTLLWGIDANTTALKMLQENIQPDNDPLLYDDNVNVTEAMKANQIDAALFDLPTALYLGAVVLDDGVVLGQFPAERSETPDQFGLLMEQNSALKVCVDEALLAMTTDGTLASIEAEWLQETTGVPLIK
ncbi:MAG: polar amino acid transport system substrate-binding protein [Granulosicoccus sp.]|jgi:polar amino acid transport system substrate-binding protein